MAQRFDYVLSVWKRLAGDTPVGFDNATYLSELRTADRNFALAYFMKDAGAFPETVRTAEDVQRTLEFYFQCCSILGTCESMASAAATLANGGVHPITQEYVAANLPPDSSRFLCSDCDSDRSTAKSSLPRPCATRCR